MLQLRVVQAEFGDCLILEYGAGARAGTILIDGGPFGTYQKHLRPELEAIRARGGCIDLAVLSHVDNDHVIGLLELAAELKDNRAAGKPEIIPINALWHNTFNQTVAAGTDIAERIETVFSSAPPALSFMDSTSAVAFGIQEGSQLQLAGADLGVPLNQGFSGGVITTESAPRPLEMGELKLWVVGPSERNLERLRKKWQVWLEKLEERVNFADQVEAIKLDQSVPNLSSIMLLAEAGGRRYLLAGDGLGGDAVEGLQQVGLLQEGDTFHVDVLKLPHHGSARNVTRSFFETIIADTYVVSANGRYHNPDLAALIWVVEAARKQGRQIRILATNPTEATGLLADQYPAAEYGYTLEMMGENEHSVVI